MIGDTARIRLISGDRYQGVVVGQTADTIVLRCVPVGDHGVPARPAETYTRQECRLGLDEVIEVSTLRGRARHPGAGAMIGALIAGVAGAFIGGAACSPSAFDCDVFNGVVAGFVVFGAGGALVGTGVGVLITSERWDLVVLRDPSRQNVTHGLAMRIYPP